MSPRASLPKRHADFPERGRRQCVNPLSSRGRRAIPHNPLITKEFSKSRAVSSTGARAAPRFFRRWTRVVGVGRESTRGIDARRRSGMPFVARTRSRRPERRVDDCRRAVRAVAFLFRPFVSPNGSRARRRPILDSSGAMHIFSAEGENSGSVEVENAKIANLWQIDSRTIRRRKSDSRRENFAARAFSTRLSRRLRRVRRMQSMPRCRTVAVVARVASSPSTVANGLDPRFGNGRTRVRFPSRIPHPAFGAACNPRPSPLFSGPRRHMPSETRHRPRSGSLPA